MAENIWHVLKLRKHPTLLSEKIEAVLISGDIYDRSIPPADAVDILNKFLNTLIKTLKVKVFIISGNHDSKERLNFGSQIFENDGLYIKSTYICYHL